VPVRLRQNGPGRWPIQLESFSPSLKRSSPRTGVRLRQACLEIRPVRAFPPCQRAGIETLLLPSGSNPHGRATELRTHCGGGGVTPLRHLRHALLWQQRDSVAMAAVAQCSFPRRPSPLAFACLLLSGILCPFPSMC
jgi:hypothetical protein